MRLGLAGESVSHRASALVLGSPMVATALQGRLESMGFQTLQEGQLETPLPAPWEPRSVERLRLALEAYMARHPTPGEHLLHPGVSPWAERPELVTLGQELGFTVLAPSTRVVSLFGNRLALLEEAAKQGIPHLALSFDPLHSVREIEMRMGQLARKFPLVLKSVRGGSGAGIFVAHSQEDLDRKLPLWLDQLGRNVGEVMLLMERYVEDAVRVVCPFARLRDGTFQAFPKVDATLQHGYRKLVQFCPAWSVEPALAERLDQWTRALAESSGFVGVGSIEFFLHGDQCYLLEGLARLNTDFLLWEGVAGTSALEWQLLAAHGRSQPVPQLKQEESWSNALSLRLYAEDPVLRLPQPGVIRELSSKREWKFPKGEAFLVLPYAEGDAVSPDSDGIVGCLYVGASDRRQALANSAAILDELWVAGGLQLNDRYLAEVVRHPWVQAGMVHSGFLEEEFIPEVRPEGSRMVIMATLANHALNQTHTAEKVSPLGARWAVGDQWVRPTSTPLEWARPPEPFEHRGLLGLSGYLKLGNEKGADATARVCLFPLAPGRWCVRLGTWVLTVRLVQPRPTGSTRSLFSLVTGRVHAVLFREGTTVPAHEPAVVIESLKRLVPHSFPADVRVLSWKVRAEDSVEAGQLLAELDV